jgi:hypothetical protein
MDRQPRRGDIFEESAMEMNSSSVSKREMPPRMVLGNDANWKNCSSALSFRMKLKLAARKAESPGVESFIFKPEKPLVWKAGQFLHYVLNHYIPQNIDSRRTLQNLFQIKDALETLLWLRNSPFVDACDHKCLVIGC